MLHPNQLIGEPIIMLSTNDGCRIAIHSLRKQSLPRANRGWKPRHLIALCVMLNALQCLSEIILFKTMWSASASLS